MIFAEFIRWYYFESPKEIFTIWKNLLHFCVNLFGLRYHLATFFRPWRLIVVDFGEEGLVRKWLFAVAAKVIGSGIGMVMRTLLIVCGLVSWLFIFVFGIVAQILWLVLPFGLVLVFFQGLAYLV